MYKMKYFMIAVVCSLLISGCTSVKPEIGQVVFSSPEEAVAALGDATGKNDANRLMEIFGQNAKDIVYSGDDKYDVESRAMFAQKAGEKTNLVKDGELIIVEIGNDNFPFAVPLAIYDGKAFFYTAAGKEEVINRRIGRNEIFTINVCEALAKTEVEDARRRVAIDGVREYAMKFINQTGKVNELYWNPETGKKENLICAALANAALEPGNPKREPYYGYYYKVLKAQGPDAPGGKKSYLVDGKMKNGFALVAYPANYGALGIKTFIVSRSGVVFEKDLGDDTEKTASEMTEYNPDDTWDPVGD